jgi:hypothetical protein
MHAAGAGQVDDQRLDAVQQLQQQEIDDLGGAGGARLRQARGQQVAALVQQADQLVGEGGQARRGAEVQAWRAVVGVEHQAVVGAPLDRRGHAQRGVGVRHLGLLEREAQAQLPTWSKALLSRPLLSQTS